jgi:hypothetical protein
MESKGNVRKRKSRQLPVLQRVHDAESWTFGAVEGSLGAAGR